MKKLTQFLVAAAMVVGGSALAQTATQTVTTNVAGAVSISLTDTNNSAVAALTTQMTAQSAGNTTSGTVTLNVKSSDTTGFHVSAKTDNASGKMCEYDTASSAYTATCLANPLKISSSNATGFSGTPTLVSTATALSSTDLKVVSSTEAVSAATVDTTVAQLFDWTDKVLTTNKYQVVITYTISGGV